MAMTEEEKASLKATMAERARARKKMSPEQLEAEVLALVDKMSPADKAIAKKVHALVKKTAPLLQAKTWYGMQAYCDAEGKTILFFQDGGKYKTRYSTIGFQQAANLDKGEMWPTSYAVLKWTPEVEKQLTALIKKAIK